jgi:hypothetical protein
MNKSSNRKTLKFQPKNTNLYQGVADLLEVRIIAHLQWLVVNTAQNETEKIICKTPSNEISSFQKLFSAEHKKPLAKRCSGGDTVSLSFFFAQRPNNSRIMSFVREIKRTRQHF